MQRVVGGGPGGLVAPARVLTQPVFSRYSATICVYRSQQPTLLSAVNVVRPHISDKSHSPALSLEGIFFFFFTERAQRSIRFYTWAADVNFKTPLHSSCRSYSLSKQEKDIHHSNYPTTPVYRNLCFLQLTTPPYVMQIEKVKFISMTAHSQDIKENLIF